MRDESVLTGESKNLDHSRGSPSRFHFSQSSRQQHLPGQVLFRFRPVARVSYYVNIPSLFLPARRFLLLYLSSVPCQQIIKKRESSSINIAPVFLFLFFFSSSQIPSLWLWEYGGCAESPSLTFRTSACLHVFSSSAGLFVWTSHSFLNTPLLHL